MIEWEQILFQIINEGIKKQLLVENLNGMLYSNENKEDLEEFKNFENEQSQ